MKNWRAGWRSAIDRLAPQAELVLVDERGYVEGCDHRPIACAVWLIVVDGRPVVWSVKAKRCPATKKIHTNGNTAATGLKSLDKSIAPVERM